MKRYPLAVKALEEKIKKLKNSICNIEMHLEMKSGKTQIEKFSYKLRVAKTDLIETEFELNLLKMDEL